MINRWNGVLATMVATPEDLIVLKLIANRSRDRLDVEELARHRRIDWPYVEEWATTWGVADRLQALRDTLTAGDD